VSSFLCSWDCENASALGAHFDSVALLKEPTHEESFNRLPHQPIWFSDSSHYCHNTASLYKFFYQSRHIVSEVKNTGIDFDYIVMTRPDLRIRISNINNWLNDYYNVPGMSYVNFNDHINISTRNNMFSVWNYSDEYLDDVVKQSLDTEDVLKKLVTNCGIQSRSHVEISEYLVRDFNVVSFYQSGGYEMMKKQLGVA
jgi:hypothetical protein